MTTPSRAARASAPEQDALAALGPLLACPSCRHDAARLVARADTLVCDRCKTAFPVYASGGARVPWLFRDPETVRLEWRSRYNGFLHACAEEQTRLQSALDDPRRVSRAAAGRITQLLRAREAQRKQIVELLSPLKLGAARAEPNLDRAGVLHGELRKRRAQPSSYDQLFRDWSWESGENESFADCVRRVLPAEPSFKAGRTLTLGSGACRLSYDFHRRYAPELSVAVDFRPLLLLAAARVTHGEPVELHEFPIAPLDKASVAVARSCAAPEPLPASRFTLVLADVPNAPFKPASFDTVLTPWLVDTAPGDPVDCVRTVNRLLKNGGSWVNTGSLGFFHRNEAWCYSAEEALDLVAASGFEVIATERNAVPYLQSPASGRSRIERSFTFYARKTADVAAPERTEDLPAWLLDARRPVPDLDEFVVASAHRLLQAQILGAIDGRRGIDEIAQLVAKRYGLQKIEAEGAVRRVLIELYGTTLTEKAAPESFLE